MRRSKVKRGRRHGSGGLTVFAVLGIGGIACLLAGWNAYAPRGASLSPAEIVAVRFPDARYQAFDEVADARTPAAPANLAAPADDTDTNQYSQYSLFSPYPGMSPPSSAAMPASYQTASLASTPVELAPTAASPAGDAGPKAEHKAEPKAEIQA